VFFKVISATTTISDSNISESEVISQIS